jgi:hypothetical protein
MPNEVKRAKYIDKLIGKHHDIGGNDEYDLEDDGEAEEAVPMENFARATISNGDDDDDDDDDDEEDESNNRQYKKTNNDKDDGDVNVGDNDSHCSFRVTHYPHDGGIPKKVQRIKMW